MNVLAVQEVDRDCPWTRTDDLVDPPAMLYYFRPLFLIHHNFALLLDRFFVATHTHDQMRVLEQLLGLLQHLRMAHVEHVEDAIGIHAHRIVWI